MHILFILVVLWVVFYFLADVFGGTPGHTKPDPYVPPQRQDYRDPSIDKALTAAEWAGMGRIVLILLGVSGVIGFFLCLKY